MGKISISTEIVTKAINTTSVANDTILRNIRMMNENVNSQFIGLNDPSLVKYLELSGKMTDVLKQISNRLDSISEYCQKILAWINKYSDY